MTIYLMSCDKVVVQLVFLFNVLHSTQIGAQMFTGLSAFPLTPFKNDKIDFSAFERLLDNLVTAKVDSICAMGSTGLYPYLSRDELTSVAQKTVAMAGDIPVMAGIGSLRTIDVLKNAEAAQKAGVNAVLLAPVSYHPLNESEVYSLFQSVTKELSVPLCVYENPRCTNFTFSDELYRRITQLPNVASIKVPGMPFATEQGATRLATLRKLVPQHVGIGVSGDMYGAAGMAAGCDLWLSVIGGLFPNLVKQIIHSVQSNVVTTSELQQPNLDELWQLFARNGGGLRVMAAASKILGLCDGNCLPAPLMPIPEEDQIVLKALLERLQLS